MRCPSLTALSLLLALAFGGPVWAEVPESEAPRPDGFLERMGSPARPDVVAEALREVESGASDRAYGLCLALEQAGGVAAARALAPLLAGADEMLVLAVLHAAGHLALRDRALVEAVRHLSRDPDDLTRAQAIESLGAIGDGRDMPLLLAACAEGRPAEERRAAFRALGRLTGSSLPYEESRWRYLWKELELRARTQLSDALDAIERDPDAADTDAHLRVVRDLGWVDLRATEAVLRAWLPHPERHLRAHACDLIAALRLADLAEELVKVRIYRRLDGPSGPAAERAIHALGIVLPPGPGDFAHVR